MISREEPLVSEENLLFSSEGAKRSSGLGLKILLFVLFSLNVTLFLWETNGRGGFFAPDAAVRPQLQDPSVPSIVLVREKVETSGSSNPDRRSTASSEGKLPEFKNEPAILESVNRHLFKSISASAETLIDGLLDSESAKQIDVYSNREFGEIDDAAKPEISFGFEAFCCPEMQARAQFAALEEAAKQAIATRMPAGTDLMAEPDNAGANTPVASGLPAETEPVEEAKGASQILCYRAGPSLSSDGFSRIVRDLERDGIQAVVETESIEVETAFRVVYPAGETFEESKSKVKELKEKGLGDNDIWLIPEGPDRGVISLGFFKKRERAEIRRAELEEKGIDSQIRPRLSNKPAYFMRVSSSFPADAIEARLIAAGFKAEDFGGIEQRNCGD